MVFIKPRDGQIVVSTIIMTMIIVSFLYTGIIVCYCTLVFTLIHPKSED